MFGSKNSWQNVSQQKKNRLKSPTAEVQIIKLLPGQSHSKISGPENFNNSDYIGKNFIIMLHGNNFMAKI